MENNLRLNNLMIHELIEVPKVDAEQLVTESKKYESSGDSETTQAVLDLCNNRLGLEVTGSDVSYVFRVPTNTKGGCRSVIVRFVNRKIRNLVYSSRKSFHSSSEKGSNGNLHQ